MTEAVNQQKQAGSLMFYEPLLAVVFY